MQVSSCIHMVPLREAAYGNITHASSARYLLVLASYTPVTSKFHRPPCTVKLRTSARMEMQQLMVAQPRFFGRLAISPMGR